MENPKFIIAVDFDLTICDSNYPECGEPIEGAIETINSWYDRGFGIVINTCRAEDPLIAAKNWLDEHGVRYHHINENFPHLIELYGMDCRKISADVYIDDKNLGGLQPWWLIETMIENAYNKKMLYGS